MMYQVHRLDRESSGLLLMGRTKESIAHLHWLFSDINKAKTSCEVYLSHYTQCHLDLLRLQRQKRKENRVYFLGWLGMVRMLEVAHANIIDIFILPVTRIYQIKNFINVLCRGAKDQPQIRVNQRENPLTSAGTINLGRNPGDNTPNK